MDDGEAGRERGWDTRREVYASRSCLVGREGGREEEKEGRKKGGRREEEGREGVRKEGGNAEGGREKGKNE